MGSSCQKRRRASHGYHPTWAQVTCLRRARKGSLFMLRRYQDCDGGSKHEYLSALLRTRSLDSASDETGDAFAVTRRGMHVTGDAFAAGKWPEIGCFVRAEVSAVSFRVSDPPALVSSVSGKVVGRCCESTLATSARKFRPAGEKRPILGCFVCAGRTFSRVGADGGEQGEFCRACGA